MVMSVASDDYIKIAQLLSLYSDAQESGYRKYEPRLGSNKRTSPCRADHHPPPTYDACLQLLLAGERARADIV